MILLHCWVEKIYSEERFSKVKHCIPPKPCHAGFHCLWNCPSGAHSVTGEIPLIIACLMPIFRDYLLDYVKVYRLTTINHKSLLSDSSLKPHKTNWNHLPQSNSEISTNSQKIALWQFTGLKLFSSFTSLNKFIFWTWLHSFHHIDQLFWTPISFPIISLKCDTCHGIKYCQRSGTSMTKKFTDCLFDLSQGLSWRCCSVLHTSPEEEASSCPGTC